jgi:hypothetical protein
VPKNQSFMKSVRSGAPSTSMAAARDLACARMYVPGVSRCFCEGFGCKFRAGVLVRR